MARHYITVNRFRAAACVALVGLIVPSTVRAERPGIAWGTGIGYPQLIPIVMEIRQESPLRLQLTASPLLLINSATARLIVIPPNWRVRPYAYAGGGVLNINESNGSSWTGTTGFLWLGGGLRVRIGRLDFFAEVGSMAAMEEGREFEPGIYEESPDDNSIALGLLLLPAEK